MIFYVATLALMALKTTVTTTTFVGITSEGIWQVSLSRRNTFNRMQQQFFYHMTHTRLDRSLAQGVGDEDSNSQALQLAPRISQDAKSFIWNRLDAGFISKQIFYEHLRVWQEKKRFNQPMQKDNYMTMDIIHNLEMRHSKGKGKDTILKAKVYNPGLMLIKRVSSSFNGWRMLQTFHMINSNHSSWEFNLLNNVR